MLFELPHNKLEVYVTDRQLAFLKRLSMDASKQNGYNLEPEDIIRQILYRIIEEYQKKGYDV